MKIKIVKVKELDNDVISLFKDLIKYETTLSKYFNIKKDKELKPILLGFFENITDKQTNCVLKAVYNKKTIGFVIGGILTMIPYNKMSHIGFVEDMYIIPEYRKRGIGKMLLEEINKFFLESHVTESITFVLSNNKDAIKAYEGLGYKEDSIKMVKKLK